MKKETKNTLSLNDRMKSYEEKYRNILPSNGHYIIRLDGRSFSNYTKKFKTPFDELFINAMDYALLQLCKKVQGAKFGYVQSDEISVYFTDTDSEATQLYFNGNTQKINSVSATIVANAFNRYMLMNSGIVNEDWLEQFIFAEFDCRIIELPNIVEVHNCFLWRQQDNLRNSVAQVAQSHYSHKELFKKNINEQKQLLIDINDDWNMYPEGQKMGRVCYKKTYNDELTVNSRFIIQDAKHMIEADYFKVLNK